VLTDGTRTIGEGFHRAHGEPHAEVEALRDARARGADPAGATLYVTLEPCNHAGATGPCAAAVIDAAVARVVVGTRDPNPVAAGGVERLRTASVAVTIADDAWCRALVEDFSVFVCSARPYVRLKLAASIDGYIAPAPGRRYWLTGDESRAYVRELRATHDAVLVGAGTVRVDDPQLTVRPPRGRRRPYVRVVACEQAAVGTDRAIFSSVDGYAPTIVLAPAGLRAQFAPLEAIAEVAYVGDDAAIALDLRMALETLRSRGIVSVLCEGGPTLAARLIAADLVDRFDWLVAPVVLHGPGAVLALAGADGKTTPLRFDRVEQLGPDVLLSAGRASEGACSAD